jgi:oxygen-dependent protoporphyrinogen oxidase
MSRRIAIVGAGISGLAAAVRLRAIDRAIDLVVLEASDRAGGVLQTESRDGYLIERSADNFITNVPGAIDFCRSVGLADELLPTNPKHRGALVVCRGRLERIPPGFLVMAPTRIGSILSTPILSLKGKLRLSGEYFIRAKQNVADETLASFARRRLGREVYERLVQPLVGGIYTADPEKLSLRATLPRFLDMERDAGGLIRGALRERRNHAADEPSGGVRYGMFTAPKQGMASLVDGAINLLPNGALRLSSPVERIERSATGGWSLEVGGPAPERIEADGLIVAAPSRHASKLLSTVDAELSQLLGEIEHASCAVVSLGYRREQIGRPLDAFGFVVPQIERRRILSASFSSVKYPGRAPEGCELIRVFIGGALQSELLEQDDASLVRIALEELADLLSIRGEREMSLVARWSNVMPQYHVGHLDRVERIESRTARHGPLALAGNAYRGVGIPQCIQSGAQAAEQVAATLGVVDGTT